MKGKISPVFTEISLGSVAGARDFDEPAVSVNLTHHHQVLGQRSGLVTADNRGAAQRFHRGQVFNQRMSLAHPGDRHRKRKGDGGKQPFRHIGDEEPNEEYESVHKRETADKPAQ